ncbi:MAG: ATP-grasp domain-containing protein, partial [Oscillospiraceae bacterium]|nr:ATP-grasp domain-containing protein [Oscillospiraceae bacterium]
KSVKETDFPKVFDAGITQEQLDDCIHQFKELRGSLYTGCICIKEYLNLKRYDGRTNEYRVFYMNHEIGTVCRNAGQGSFTPEPPQSLLQKYQTLDSPYYTVDFAETESGEWKILETGDGQVSGLSDFQDADAYYRALYHAFVE